jgi:hypothetical protein
MDSEAELPTPKKEDVLFASDQAIGRMDAILEFRPGNDYTYRQGYRRAGRVLTEYVASYGEVDFLVFPICHAYRHHVELSLKRLIVLAGNLADRVLTRSEEKLQNGSHNLVELWETFKVVHAEAEAKTGIAPPPPEDMDGIEAYIHQLHAVDAGSFSFRYPLAKDGKVNLDGIERINVGRFSECMEALCNYLDGWDSYFADIIQTSNEIHDEAYGEMYGDMEY